MKKSILKSFDKGIVFLLFIIGVFSSCSKDEPLESPEYGVIFMYGVLQSEYKENITLNQETTNLTQDIPIESQD